MPGEEINHEYASRETNDIAPDEYWADWHCSYNSRRAGPDAPSGSFRCQTREKGD
jgi:hypothetical protein